MPPADAARAASRSLRALCIVIAGYFLAALLLGLVPVNRSFAPASDGIEIFLVTNGLHAGIAMPAPERGALPEAHLPLPPDASTDRKGYIVVGWGDSRVYPATGTLRDLTLMNAATALLGLNGAVMHIEHVPRPSPSRYFRSTRISDAGYRRLLAHVAGSLKRDATGRPVRIAGASHGGKDAFFEAHGRYQPFYTCNEWVRDGLSAAGVRTALWSPFDIALFHQFPSP